MTNYHLHKIVIIGAGKIGYSVAKMLNNSGRYSITLIDSNKELIDRISHSFSSKNSIHKNILFNVVDLFNEKILEETLRNNQMVLSACPFTANVAIAKAALKTGVSYFDLTEDVQTTLAIQKIAASATDKQIFMPQCGLAPGFIGILAYDIFSTLDRVEELKMRVGALPRYPSNRLKYNLTWSTEGLINEYANSCDAIINFEKQKTIPLEEVEIFAIEGVEYEAFNTSGGLGTLCDTLDGKVRNMNYKTLRYPGHAELMKFLINDLDLGTSKENRTTLVNIFNGSIPTTHQDVVLAFCNIKGYKDNKLIEYSRLFRINNQEINGEAWTAIQLTTASGVCVAIDLHINDMLDTKSGFVTQEEIKLSDFLSNEFGYFYKQGELAY
jgi:saccharopine dehydrogenase-like NADP-dependent oxidoreductase